MFIVRFQGGLGNQLFEYAFYRALQEKYATVHIKADLLHKEHAEHNGFELESVFGIQVNEASPREVALLSDRYPSCMRFSPVYNFVMKRVAYVTGMKDSVIEQPDYSHYYEEVWGLSPLKSYYLKGVWAHEDYYGEIRDILLSELEFQGEPDQANQTLENKIASTSSVSVHYRGGDYLTIGANMLDAHYYSEASRHVEARVESPKYFLFTDDVDSMRAAGVFQVFEEKNYEFVDINKGMASHKDMRLMSKCKHNIIANSSFSYWAAELNRNADKIVVSSRKAFSKSNRHGFTRRCWLQI